MNSLGKLSFRLTPLELSACTVHSVSVDAPMYTVISVLVSDFARGSARILNSVYLQRMIVLVKNDLHYMI